MPHKPPHQADLKILQKRLEVDFDNEDLLLQAVTHRSYSSSNNERLEFLGDALLESFVTKKLFHLHKKTKEGDLTRIRSKLVCEETLYSIAQKLELSNFLRLGPGELKTGGERRKSILADAVEAILAAIFLDRGEKKCEEVAEKLFADMFKNSHNFAALKDSKTRLQEYLQARGKNIPTYVIEEKRENKTETYIRISVSSEDYRCEAVATNRKKAEQQAAEEMLNLYLQENNKKK